MLTILNFPCLISQKHCELTLTDETIEIKGADIYLEIEISLKAKMRWNITEKGIHSMYVGELTIQAYNDDLDQLKQHLDGRVTYLGIQNYYETIEILSEKNTCKVCLLADRFTNLQLCCKSMRKDAYEIGQLHQSIMIQYKLQQYREFPKIYEIYESKNHIYIVMEQLDKQINLDLTHEEIQNIVYDLFRIVKILIQNKIDYQLKFSKLRLDVKGNLKLLTCSKACNCKDIEADMYLYNIGKIMIQLYGIDHFNAKKIGDMGNEFIFGLINPNLDYRFSLDDALKHEYITSIMCETNLQMKKFINPKFITQVYEHSNLQSSYYLQNDFK